MLRVRVGDRVFGVVEAPKVEEKAADEDSGLFKLKECHLVYL